MRKAGLQFAALCCCAWLLLGLSHAQTSEPAPSPSSAEKSAATIHSESRLVVLDVVVTGRHGQPAVGLTKSDFMIFEDGKPQPIVSFEAHVPPPVKTSEVLPANQYTNLSDQTPSSINVVLFDLLNTPLTDQSYAREQMVQFLKTLPPGQQVSLFELGTKLRMIAGFGTTSDQLVVAARKVVPRMSPLLDTGEDRQYAADQLGLQREGSMNQEFFDRMHDFMGEVAEARDEQRAQLTLQALTDLAGSVSGFRGRKNIMWLSEEFPVYFGPGLAAEGDRSSPDVRTYRETMRDMAGRLSSAQVSIYPIDVKGLTSAVPSASSGGTGTPAAGTVQAIESLHISMDDLATQTGGHAYYNTNDLRLAMQQSLENGAHYYTLAYVPAAKKWDSRYHRVKVQMARGGLEAEYRKGYFATPESPRSEAEAVANLLSATQAAAPPSTMLWLKAQVTPPDRQHPKLRVDCVVDGAGLTFSTGSDNLKHARLRFLTVAWDRELKEIVRVPHTVDLALSPEKYDHAMHNGIAAHQELQLKPGGYRIRLGVMDDGSQKIGTLDIPVEIDDEMKQVPPGK